MKSKIYVISGRYGCALDTPMICYSKEEAESTIKGLLADCVRGDHSREEMKTIIWC